MKSKRALVPTLPVSIALCILAGDAAAFSNAPTFLGHSGLASSDASKDVNIALHKAVLSGAIKYQGTERTEHPDKAFDGDDNTSTGQAGNITVDLGAVYVVDSMVVKFASKPPTEYHVQWSPYLGSAELPPTYDLATGLGSVPASETANQDYNELVWINDAGPTHALPAQPTRFLNFHFLQVFSGQWSNGSVNEIEVNGHPYVPSAGDEVFLSRKKWLPTAYADAAPQGEGQTITHAIDAQFTNVWLPRTPTVPGQWYQVDLGEEVSFNQIYIVFDIGHGAPTPNALNLFASNDAANWGTPIAQLDYGESTTKSFPLQKKRYIRLEQTTTNAGYWQIDELNLLAPVSVGAVVAPDAGSFREGGLASPEGGMVANPTTGAGGAGGSASGNSGAADANPSGSPGAGGSNPMGGNPGAVDGTTTAGGCACRGAPHPGNTGSAASLVLMALGAHMIRARRTRQSGEIRVRKDTSL